MVFCSFQGGEALIEGVLGMNCERYFRAVRLIDTSLPNDELAERAAVDIFAFLPLSKTPSGYKTACV